jgi:hypothetical protein
LVFEIEQRFAALERLIKQAEAKGLDEQQASNLCRLGSVLICGNIERCVEILITQRLMRAAAPQVAGFLKSYFKRGTNYDCAEICELLFRFDKSWGHGLEGAIAAETRESISSCYAVRNSVAHGGQSSLGPRSLRQYFEASFTLIAELEKAIH